MKKFIFRQAKANFLLFPWTCNKRTGLYLFSVHRYFNSRNSSRFLVISDHETIVITLRHENNMQQTPSGKIRTNA